VTTDSDATGKAATMTARKSAKVHFVTSASTGYTYCGRYVTMTLQVSRNAAEVTCATCLKEAAHPDRAPSRKGD
jgi:hypothetical protein